MLSLPIRTRANGDCPRAEISAGQWRTRVGSPLSKGYESANSRGGGELGKIAFALLRIVIHVQIYYWFKWKWGLESGVIIGFCG